MNKMLVAGPCVIERDGDWLTDVALAIKEQIPPGYKWTLKASVYKGNRTEGSSFRSIGWKAGLEALCRARIIADVPICTDVHSVKDIVSLVQEQVDVIHIPERLSRETCLLEAASMTGRKVLLKCGLSMSAAKFGAAVEKVGRGVIGCYRGTAYGDDVVLDTRRIWDMARYAPLIVDITHSTQRLEGVETRADRRFSVPYAKVAAGLGSVVDGLFLECHLDPDKALSDSASQLRISRVGELLRGLEWAS